jgi:hypothetical protein
MTTEAQSRKKPVNQEFAATKGTEETAISWGTAGSC